MPCGFGDKECAICFCGSGHCIAAMLDDYWQPATKEQLISRLNNNEYSSYRQLMIDTLYSNFNIKYNIEKEQT